MIWELSKDYKTATNIKISQILEIHFGGIGYGIYRGHFGHSDGGLGVIIKGFEAKLINWSGKQQFLWKVFLKEFILAINLNEIWHGGPILFPYPNVIILYLHSGEMLGDLIGDLMDRVLAFRASIMLHSPAIFSTWAAIDMSGYCSCWWAFAIK